MSNKYQQSNFHKKVEEIMEKQGLRYPDAYLAARKQFPDLFEQALRESNE